MKVSHELIKEIEASFPFRIICRNSQKEYIYVHPHWHRQIELLYITEGSCVQQIENRILKAKQGDLIVIDSEGAHSTYTDIRLSHNIIVIQFDPLLLCPGTGNTKNTLGFSGIIRNDNPESPRIKELLQRLNQTYIEKDNDIAQKYFILSSLFELAGIIRKNFKSDISIQRSGYVKSKTKILLKEVFSWIDENYMNPITLEDAAGLVHMSKTHFCRLFKDYTGMTFHKYLTFYRIEKSALMLRDDISITGLANLCGYTNTSAYIRSFRRQKGCTPMAFREKFYD